MNDDLRDEAKAKCTDCGGTGLKTHKENGCTLCECSAGKRRIAATLDGWE